MRLRLPPIDDFSFWLGFILATALWWVLSLVRPAVQQLIEAARARRAEKRERARAVNVVEEHYRQTVLVQAQGMHLAAPLFALDEILIPPRLMAPPPRLQPGGATLPEDIVASTLPYLPAWPELAAIYKAKTISLNEALSGDADIVLIGQTGMGKTTALAALASALARREPLPGLPENTVPFLVHIADLDLPADRDNPLGTLIDFIAEKVPIFDRPRLPEFVRRTFAEGRALLLLDGTDELPPEHLKAVVDFIKLIKRTYPKTRIVTTASTEYLDGLVSLNFFPLAIAAWNEEQRAEFLHKWAELWDKYVAREAWAQEAIELVDPLLLNQWLQVDADILTPLELTLKTWGAYAGDLQGGRPLDALETHIRRTLPTGTPRQALEVLAAQVHFNLSPIFDPRKAREWVQSFEPAEAASPPEAQEGKQAKKVKKAGKDNAKAETPSLGLLSILAKNGLLTLHRNNRMRFAHPIFGGYLAGCALGNYYPQAILEQPPWIGKYLAMHYLAATGDASLLADALLEKEDRPLARNLMVVARWLREAPREAAWRGRVMAALVALLQQEGQPLALRGQALAAFVLQRLDPGIALLFRELLKKPAPELLQLAALGAGALRDGKAVEALTSLALNPSPALCRAACLALATIGSQSALDALADLLLHGQEHQRRIAAEALANHPQEGHAMLKEAATFQEDLMVRRAAAYGLARIPEGWAEELLTKMQIEDKQWVVRNAAAEAMEIRRQAAPYIPHRLPPPTESPWLIAYASKLGMGITPDKPPVDLLLSALQSGSLEERLAALDYLRIVPTEGVFGVLFQAMYSGDPDLREAVFHTISEMAARGVDVPDPAQFGVGY